MSQYNVFTSNQSSPSYAPLNKPLQNTSPIFIPAQQTTWTPPPHPPPHHFSHQEQPKSTEEIPYDARILLEDADDLPSSSSDSSESPDFMPDASEKINTFSLKEWDFGQDEAVRRKSEILQTSSPLLLRPSSSSGEGSLNSQELSAFGKVMIKPIYLTPLNVSTHAKSETKNTYFMVLEGFTITQGKRFFKIEKLCHNLRTMEGSEARDFLYISLWGDNQGQQPQTDSDNIFEPWIYALPHMHFRLVLTVYMTHAYQDPYTFEYLVDLRQYGLPVKEKRTQNLEVVYAQPGKSSENNITLHIQLTNDKAVTAAQRNSAQNQLFSEYAVILRQIFIQLPLYRPEAAMPALSPLITHGIHRQGSNDVYAKRGSAIVLGQEHKSPFGEHGPSSPMSWSNFSPEESSPLQKFAPKPQRIPSDPQRPPGLDKKVGLEAPNQNHLMQGGSLFGFRNKQRFSIQAIKTEPEEIVTRKRVDRIRSSDLSVVLEGTNKSPLKILEAYVNAVKGGTGAAGAPVGEVRRGSNNTNSDRSSIFARIQHASTGLTDNDLASLNTLNASSHEDSVPEMSMPEIEQAEKEESSQRSDASAEDFKVEEHIGKIAEYSKTYQGSKVLQKFIINSPKEELSQVVQEIGEKIKELMVDQYSSHILQLLVQYGSPQQRLYLLQKLAPFFVLIARDKQGTHSLQAILGLLNSSTEFSLLKVMIGGSSFELSLDPRANYVIQKLINIIPVELAYFLYQPLFDNFVQVANNSFGLLVLKQMMTRVEHNEVFRQKIVDLACTHFEKLIQNPYGNYALQHVLEFFTNESHMIMSKIINKLIPYSSQKISSNVIEKFLAVCDSQFRRRVVDEILNNNRLGDLMKNKYGNFVALQLLATASDIDKQRLMQEVYRCANIFSGTKYKARWIKFVEENPLKIDWSVNRIITQEEADLAQRQAIEEEEKVTEVQEGKNKEIRAEKLEEVKKIWREMTKEEKTETVVPTYVKPKGKKNFNNKKGKNNNFKGWLSQPE